MGRPGHELSGPIKLKSRGVLPVAVLASPQFDATALDPSTVYCGTGSARETHGLVHLEDVDGDGLTDAVLHFRISALGLTPTSTTLECWGYTLDKTLGRGVAPIAVK